MKLKPCALCGELGHYPLETIVYEYPIEGNGWDQIWTLELTNQSWGRFKERYNLKWTTDNVKI